MIVIDASFLLYALTDDGAAGRRALRRLRGEDLAAPALIDLEIVSALRGLVATGRLPFNRAEDTLGLLAVLPLERAPLPPLINRCWQLRDNLTPYDAAYVALAEVLSARLLTADARLARAPGLQIAVEVFTNA